MNPQNQKFQHNLIIRGDGRDLDEIFKKLKSPFHTFQITRHGDPADVAVLPQHTEQMLRGNVLYFGTTRLVIQFNGDKSELEQFLQKRFPKVVIVSGS